MSSLLLRSFRLTSNNISRRLPALSCVRLSHEATHGVPPPFVQRAAPSRSLPAGNELIWDDGVAPETCIDFDVPNFSTGRAIRWWLGGFSLFAILALIIKGYNPQGMKKTADRVLPYDNAKKALGN